MLRLSFNWSIKSFDLLCTTFNGLLVVVFPFALALINFSSCCVYTSLYLLTVNLPESWLTREIAIFNSARHTLDYDFIKRNPDYRHLVSTIDTGNHNWINFRLAEEAKIDLFVEGVRCATKFLQTFQWDKYKHVREDLAKAFRTEAS